MQDNHKSDLLDDMINDDAFFPAQDAPDPDQIRIELPDEPSDDHINDKDVVDDDTEATLDDTSDAGDTDKEISPDQKDGEPSDDSSDAEAISDGNDSDEDLSKDQISDITAIDTEGKKNEGEDADANLEPNDDSDTPPEDDDEYVQLTLFDDEADGTPAADDGENDKELGDEDEKERKYDPEKPRGIDTLFDFVELFIFSLVAVLLATTFLFRHTVVEGSSMEQTLFEGEHLIISDLFYTPKRGDIIVCVDYTTALKKPIVKRVIGLPGDKVQIYSNGAVFVNGEELKEDYVYNDFFTPQEYLERTVPEGKLFVLGDHRNVSSDSRDDAVGFIDDDGVLGKVLFRFYPFDKFGKVE